MTTKRGIGMLFLLLLITLSFGSVAAQGAATPAFCGNLAEADCQLIRDSQQAMTGLSSASFDLNADLNVSNIPNAPFNSLAFNLKGTGAYSVDQTQVRSLQGMDMSALASNPQQLGQYLESALNAVNGDVTLTLTLPPELIQQMSSGSQQFPSTLSVQARLVNSNGYVNLEGLQAAAPGGNIPSGWTGFELARTLRQVFEAQAGQMMGGANPLAGAMNPGMMGTFTNPETMSQFISIQRLSDAANGGAVFETTIDYGALFSSTEFGDLMRSQMKSSNPNITDAEIDQMLTMMPQMMRGLTLTATQTIDPSTKFVTSASANLDWDMTALMQAANSASGSSSSGSSATATTAPRITFDAIITYTNHNSVPAITAPEGVMVIPAETLLSSFGISGGSTSGSSTGGTGLTEEPMVTPEATMAG
jgi:hypothetical protein